MAKTITVRGTPILLDQLLASEFGAAVGRSMLTATLEANPRLADAGAILPVGSVVILPDRPASTPTRRVVSLFG